MIKLKLKNGLKKNKKNKSSKLKLIHQIRDSSYETWIKSYKTNQNKSQNLISNQPNVKR
jgi:hypothetical protein